MTKWIVLNDAVRNTDNLNIIKMTGEILEIVGDKIDTNRILLVIKLTTEFRVWQNCQNLLSFLSHFAIWCNNHIRISSTDTEFPAAGLQYRQARVFHKAPTKVNVYRFTRQGLLSPNSRRPVPPT
jgi:hypothetical protein